MLLHGICGGIDFALCSWHLHVREAECASVRKKITCFCLFFDAPCHASVKPLSSLLPCSLTAPEQQDMQALLFFFCYGGGVVVYYKREVT